MKKVLFPGSFDPFTRGHQSLVDRALALFDEVVVAIGVNENKHTEFSLDERMDMIRQLYASNQRVKVIHYKGLTMDLCVEMGISFILRGVRTIQDFEFERNLADCNRKLAGIETILFFTEPELSFVSSSNVRELRHFGKDISLFMPQID